MTAPPPGRLRAAVILTAVTLGSLAGAGCPRREPNLLRLYRRAPRPRRAVILIPGAFGSKLQDTATGKIVWGDASSLFKELYRPWDDSEDLLDLPIDAANPLDNRDGLRPAGIFEKVVGRSLYGKIWTTLREAGGYTPGDIEHPRPGQDLFTFDYDWRRDVVETAGRLGESVSRILAARGEPGGRVDLVAHSLGGVIARYYVRYGDADVLDQAAPVPTFDGGRHVHNLVFVGTPNAGTVEALRSLVEGVKYIRRLPPGAVFTMPSAYELLPYPREQVLLDAGGRPLDASLYDPATWEKLGWSELDPRRSEDDCKEIEKKAGKEEGARRCAARHVEEKKFAAWALDRARRLAAALEAPAARPDAVRYSAFGGDCNPTPARVVVTEGKGGPRTYFLPEDLPRALRTDRLADLMLEPGDGSVTRTSLLGGSGLPGVRGGSLSLTYTGFFCQRHRLLTEEGTFQDNLLHLLLERP